MVFFLVKKGKLEKIVKNGRRGGNTYKDRLINYLINVNFYT